MLPTLERQSTTLLGYSNAHTVTLLQAPRGGHKVTRKTQQLLLCLLVFYMKVTNVRCTLRKYTARHCFFCFCYHSRGYHHHQTKPDDAASAMNGTVPSQEGTNRQNHTRKKARRSRHCFFLSIYTHSEGCLSLATSCPRQPWPNKKSIATMIEPLDNRASLVTIKNQEASSGGCKVGYDERF